jgi:hypothetical protein
LKNHWLKERKKYYDFEALVLSNKDPYNAGCIKFEHPDTGDSYWAWPLIDVSSKGSYGFSNVPNVGDFVKIKLFDDYFFYIN